MVILFQNFLILKYFFACNGCLGLFTNIKKGSGLAFRAHFLMIFFWKCSLFKLYQLTKFQCHAIFCFFKISNKNKFFFRKLMTPWTLRFIFGHRLRCGTHLTFNVIRVLKKNVLTFRLHKILIKCRVPIYVDSSVQ